jgi:hypothetical protein
MTMIGRPSTMLDLSQKHHRCISYLTPYSMKLYKYSCMTTNIENLMKDKLVLEKEWDAK